MRPFSVYGLKNSIQERQKKKILVIWLNKLPLPKNKDMKKFFLYGDVEENTAEIVQVITENQDSEFELHINSNGGSVFGGFAIYNALKKTKKSRIIVDGVAASIAAIVAICGRPLFMYRNARLMLHEVSGTFSGGLSEMRQTMKVCEQLNDELVRLVAARTGEPLTDVKTKYFSGADVWITAEQAVQMGLAAALMPDEDGQQPTEQDESNTHLYNRLMLQRHKKSGKYAFSDLRNITAFSGLSDAAIYAEIERISDERCNYITFLENKAKNGVISSRELLSFADIADKNERNRIVKRLRADEERRTTANKAEWADFLQTYEWSLKKYTAEEKSRLFEWFNQSPQLAAKVLNYKRRVSDFIEDGNGGNVLNLNELRKKNPELLRQHPNLFNALIEREKQHNNKIF